MVKTKKLTFSQISEEQTDDQLTERKASNMAEAMDVVTYVLYESVSG